MRSRLVSAAGLGFLYVALFASPAGALPSNCSQSASTVRCAYTGAGTYTFTVPAGVSSLDVTAVGAAGGTSPSDDPAGQGASVEDTAYL